MKWSELNWNTRNPSNKSNKNEKCEWLINKWINCTTTIHLPDEFFQIFLTCFSVCLSDGQSEITLYGRPSVCLFVFLSRSFVFCNLKNTHTNWLNRLEHFVCILVLLVVNACIKEGINKNFDFAFAAVAVVFVVLNTRNY